MTAESEKPFSSYVQLLTYLEEKLRIPSEEITKFIDVAKPVPVSWAFLSWNESGTYVRKARPWVFFLGEEDLENETVTSAYGRSSSTGLPPRKLNSPVHDHGRCFVNVPGSIQFDMPKPQILDKTNLLKDVEEISPKKMCFEEKLDFQVQIAICLKAYYLNPRPGTRSVTTQRIPYLGGQVG